MKDNEIKKLAFELRLFGIHENWHHRCAEASSEGLTGEELLIRILEDEKQYRKNKYAKKLQTQARFRRESLLENWDMSIDRGINKTKIKELASLSFWGLKKNLIMVGPTGSGKTQLSIAIGRAACQMELSVLFISVQNFFDEVRENQVAGKFLPWIKKVKKYDIIVFDDFGLRAYTHDEAIVLIDVFEDRYRDKVHIISSQVDIDGWKSLFEDPVIADALIDRMRHPSEKIKLTASYRQMLA